MSAGLLIFFLVIVAAIAFLSPQLASGIRILTSKEKAEEQQKKDEEKAKQREDEGIFVTAGRIILGDKLLDDAKAAEKAAQLQKQIEEDTKSHLIQEFSDKSKVNEKFRNKIVLTNSELSQLTKAEQEKITIENQGQFIKLANERLRAKKGRKTTFG